MEKENMVKKLKDFAKRLMKDSGIKMSEIVLERDYNERVDYRLKDNDTLPFFHVNTGYGCIVVVVGSEFNNTRTFRFEVADDEKIDEEFYGAILPLFKKHVNKVRDELEAQIKYNGPDGRVIVRDGLVEEICLWYFMASGVRLTATKYKSGAVDIGYMEVPSRKFLEHVVTYLMEGKEDAV